jgi:DNA-binding transcriptional LysR family regulator
MEDCPAVAHPPSRTDLSGMTLFVSIVEEGSLSAAARALGMPKATVSRHLAEMERQAGGPLIARSTRSLTLTGAGRRHYERIRDLVHDARAAQAELLASNNEPSGLLRVSASVSYGQLVIAPRVVAFAARHPKLRVELDLRDEPVSVIADRYDLAIRMGPVQDSELIGHRLAEVKLVLVASPAYCARAGVPRSTAELSRHDVIAVPPDSSRWRIGRAEVPVTRRFGTRSLPAARLAALAGLGIARLPLFAVAHDMVVGDLVRVLPGAELPRSPATALHPRAVAPSAALRLLIQELKASASPVV